MKYLEQYEREQEFIIYNQDDPDLSAEGGIRIDLPTVEDFFGEKWEEAIKKIDGYGLDPAKQKFDYYRDNGYFKLPPKLLNIEETIRKRKKLKDKDHVFPEDMFEELESNPVYYREEIEWIKVIKKRALQGYWCFIKGRPTYIDGWHFTYINYWAIENENRRDRLPDYRDVDRRIFLFFRWAYTTTEAHFKYELTYRKKGQIKVRYFNNKAAALQHAKLEGGMLPLIEDNDGKGYRGVDMGYRTVFGVVFPKRRRVGATFMGSHVGTRIAIDNSLGTFAIQALTEDTATEDIYQKKILAAWRTYPFFFKPCANTADTNALVFTKKGYTDFTNDTVQHGGWIRPRSSANKAFDGNKLYAYLNDESGKKSNGDVLHEFTDTIKNALAQGQKIHGFSLYTSTFGEFESGGGKEYFELCRKSYAHKRNDNGLTASGMVTLFIPAYDGYDGYVDEYGYSVIDDPDFPFIDLEGNEKDVGAKTVLSRARQYYEEIKDWNGLNNEVRSNPFTLREAGSRSNRSNFWDVSILRQRMAELKFSDVLTRDVNLEWRNGVEWSDVVVKEPPIGQKGKFTLSMPPAEELRNKFYYDDQRNSFCPSPDLVGRYVLGCDPFAFNNKDTTGRKKSNGGGAMYMPFDPSIDSGDKPKDQWVTGDFVMTYCHRPETTDEYCEDMLLAAVLFGAMVNTERNVGHLIRYFREHKAEGYLMYNWNPVKGMFDTVVGTWTDNATKEKIFAKYSDYIKNVGERARHVEILDEVSEAQSFEDMTDLDLFAAGGMALLGAENKFSELFKRNSESKDISGYVDMYD